MATVVASCDVELTDFEVNAVNVLRPRYTVDCRVINRDIQYENTPQPAGGGKLMSTADEVDHQCRNVPFSPAVDSRPAQSRAGSRVNQSSSEAGCVRVA